MTSLFAWFWRRRLKSGERVVRVLGWRSALIDNKSGQRSRVTFLLQRPA